MLLRILVEKIMKNNVLVLVFLQAFLTVNCENVSENIQISREEFDNLKNTVSHLEELVKNQLVFNQKLQSELNLQRSMIQDFQMTITRQEEKIKNCENLETSISMQHQTNKKASIMSPVLRKRHAETTVAFFATLTQASLDHLGLHQNIVFEDVVTNIGNAYNNHQGVFVAPLSGLYLITTSVLSRQNEEYWAAVVVNGTEIVRLNGRGTDGRHGTGTQTMIIALKKGDDDSIQNTLFSNHDYWGDKYSSFGGFLIQEFETGPSEIVG